MLIDKSENDVTTVLVSDHHLNLPGLEYLCCLSRQPPAGGDDELYH